MTTALRVGYVPLSDALPLIVAQRQGFFAGEGLNVELVVMRSWAQMRDALVLGHIDAGHCLPGIPIGSQGGMFGAQSRLASALTLNHFGNAITLSKPLYDSLQRQGDFADALMGASARRHKEKRKLCFASVYPVSKHEFELRHWLRACGLDPDKDVSLQVVPPPMVAAALKDGKIDGFCVGEPWNSLAVSQGLGHVVATSRSLGLPGTEKVLAAKEEALQQPAHEALVRSLLAACHWLADSDQRRHASLWLAETLKLDSAILIPGLFSNEQSEMDRDMLFSGINRPDRWHARWLIGQIEMNINGVNFGDVGSISERAFRSDVYDQVAS